MRMPSMAHVSLPALTCLYRLIILEPFVMRNTSESQLGASCRAESWPCVPRATIGDLCGDRLHAKGWHLWMSGCKNLNHLGLTSSWQDYRRCPNKLSIRQTNFLFEANKETEGLKQPPGHRLEMFGCFWYERLLFSKGCTTVRYDLLIFLKGMHHTRYMRAVYYLPSLDPEPLGLASSFVCMRPFMLARTLAGMPFGGLFAFLLCSKVLLFW